MPFALLLAATLAAAERFEPLRAANADAPSCVANRSICISADETGRLTVTRHGAQPVAWQVTEESDSEAKVMPGPSVMRLRNGGLIVTSLVRHSQMYSGGGATAVELRLILLRAGRPPITVLTVPHSSDVLIRACFSEEDVKQRLEACHDNYTLESRLSALPRSTGGLPDLAFRMTASAFPRGVSRVSDSLEMPPLTKADLVRSEDKECTLSRTFRFDAASARYRPDRPLPACEAYTQP